MMSSKMKFLIPRVCVLVILSQVGKVYGGAGWEYTGDLGPEKWYQKFKHCGGRMQSPINVETGLLSYNADLKSFDFTEYITCKNCTMKLENVHGHTVEVAVGGYPILLRGGSLPDDYVLDQFHFHWGSNNNVGSEHTFNNKHAPLEMHIVHHALQYANGSVAGDQPYGLAVLAFFFEIGEKANPDFEPLLENFDKVIHIDTDAEIEPFPLWNLIWTVKNSMYYRYLGSLTTPPCYESVIWTLFKDKIKISQEQLDKFRTLRNRREGESKESPISDDFRPVQPLHERKVITNDPSVTLDAASYIVENLRQEIRTLMTRCSSGAPAAMVAMSPVAVAVRVACGVVAVWFWLSKLV